MNTRTVRMGAGVTCLAAAAAVVATGTARAGTLVSADGLWTAQIDGYGQVQGLIPPDGFNHVSQTTAFEANADSGMLSRKIQDNYEVVQGPDVDPDQTHSYTKLSKSVTQLPPPSGNCCEPHEEGGCEDPACEAAVCNEDFFCCDVQWDELCVEIALGQPECDCVATPPPLTIELENFMIDGPNGGVLVVIRAVNESPSEPMDVKLFYYADLDIGSPEEDEATPLFDGGNVTAIEQAIFPDQDPLWVGGCPPYKSWEIDLWPVLINALEAGVGQLAGADNTIPGPNDHTCALSSPTVTLGAGEAFQMNVGIGAPGFAGCPASPCPWDLGGDGAVGVTDLIMLLGAWGPNPGDPADFDGDGIVGILDLIKLLGQWGQCP